MLSPVLVASIVLSEPSLGTALLSMRLAAICSGAEASWSGYAEAKTFVATEAGR